jgi:1-acyl-sn-glycerol-3-phosphate acyltransferase
VTESAPNRTPLNKAQSRSLAVMRFLQKYHRHRVVNIEAVPINGPAIVVINHSLATYDAALLGAAIYQHAGRLVRPLGDRAIFKTPLLSTYATHIGVVEGSPKAAEDALAAGDLVIVAPGGMRESLRPTREAYALRWERRKGFIRLAARMNAPIILAACPRADEIYRVYENPFTKLIYKQMRMPAPVARGIGLTAIPRPVPLTHWVADLIAAPKSEDPSIIDAAHTEIVATMNGLMQRGSKSLF